MSKTNDKVAITLQIDKSTRQEWKIYAAKHDISVTEAIKKAMTEILNKEKGE